MDLNYGQVAKVSTRVRELVKGRVDSFTNPEYYPPTSAGREDILRYFFFIVAIDHRTSRFTDFEGCVDGRFYHGADLLYRLAMKKFEEDPEFYDPRRMEGITVDDVRKWLRVESCDGKVTVTIWDPDIRAYLLRDAARKLLKLYGGRVEELLRVSKGYLKSSTGYGLIDRLRYFTAYSDPVEKKAYLLVKFISRRGLLEVRDEENLEVPVDNHLTRIALRLKLVKVPEDLLEDIMKGRKFTYQEDVILRLAVRYSYRYLARSAMIDPTLLDDFLWEFGRKCCTRENPVCVKGGGSSLCRHGCPLSEYCPYSGSESAPPEHYYPDTYYY